MECDCRFAQLCQNILEENALPPSVFAEYLLPALLALRNDPIPNVRLTLARVLAQRIIPLGEWGIADTEADGILFKELWGHS